MAFPAQPSDGAKASRNVKLAIGNCINILLMFLLISITGYK